MNRCPIRPRRRLAGALALFLASLGLSLPVDAAQIGDSPARALGRRLFGEVRFSAPRGDFSTSCQNCHLFDEDPQGLRAHNDFLARSWIPWRREDPRRDHLRNSPSLLGVADQPVLHSDGEFPSLEALVRGTLTGRTFGWLPGEAAEAQRYIHQTLRQDSREQDAGAGSSYREQFRQAYSVELVELDDDQALDWVARALVDHLRTLKRQDRSPYDAFLAANDLPPGPEGTEAPGAWAGRILERILALKVASSLELPPGFGSEALDGFQIFLRSEGPSQTGNCVVCHTPPSFTDYSFHNVGVSQAEYDDVHGAGSFALLAIPSQPSTPRPVARFQQEPDAKDSGRVDLGHWNFVSLESPQRWQGERREAFLERMIATFKTPTLRNLAYTYPYMHNGAFATVTDAVEAKLRWSAQARAGALRAADEELLGIHLDASDLPPLLAFLATLGEELKPGQPPPPFSRPAVDGYTSQNRYLRF